MPLPHRAGPASFLGRLKHWVINIYLALIVLCLIAFEIAAAFHFLGQASPDPDHAMVVMMSPLVVAGVLAWLPYAAGLRRD